MGKESNANPKPQARKPVMAAIKSQSICHIYTHGQTVTHASSAEETTHKNSFSLSLVMEPELGHRVLKSWCWSGAVVRIDVEHKHGHETSHVAGSHVGNQRHGE